MAFTLTSDAFADGAPIPRRHSGEGEDLSPPLEWTDPPAGTRSFALVVEDPDAVGETFRHWGIHNIGASLRSLPEGTVGPFDAALNDYGRRAYGGPHPPRGSGRHRYYFRLAALDVPRIGLPDRTTVADLWQAVRPHILGEAVLVGTYER